MVVPGTCNYLLRKGMKRGRKEKVKQADKCIPCFIDTPKLMGLGVKYLTKCNAVLLRSGGHRCFWEAFWAKHCRGKWDLSRVGDYTRLLIIQG